MSISGETVHVYVKSSPSTIRSVSTYLAMKSSSSARVTVVRLESSRFLRMRSTRRGIAPSLPGASSLLSTLNMKCGEIRFRAFSILMAISLVFIRLNARSFLRDIWKIYAHPTATSATTRATTAQTPCRRRITSSSFLAMLARLFSNVVSCMYLYSSSAA